MRTVTLKWQIKLRHEIKPWELYSATECPLTNSSTCFGCGQIGTVSNPKYICILLMLECVFVDIQPAKLIGQWAVFNHQTGSHWWCDMKHFILIKKFFFVKNSSSLFSILHILGSKTQMYTADVLDYSYQTDIANIITLELTCVPNKLATVCTWKTKP